MPVPMEVSQLSFEGSEIRAKLGADSTAETKKVFPKNQSADDSCLYAKAKVNDSRRKKKGLNQTMKERQKDLSPLLK